MWTPGLAMFDNNSGRNWATTGVNDPQVQQANWGQQFAPLGGGMSGSELARLQGAGYDTSSISNIMNWARNANTDPRTGKANPIQDPSQLGFLNNMANESRYREMLGLNQLQGLNAEQGMGQAYGAFGGGLQGLMQGYDTARQEIQGVGQSAVGGLMAREQQQLGESRTSLQSRGLGNTTVVDNARRGIQSGTNTGLADISERIAGLRGGLAERRGASMMSAGQGLSDLLMRGTDYQNSILGERAGMLERRQDYFKGNAPQKSTSFWNSPSTGAAIGAAGGIGAAAILAGALM